MVGQGGWVISGYGDCAILMLRMWVSPAVYT